jgi:hypothetical protein
MDRHRSSGLRPHEKTPRERGRSRARRLAAAAGALGAVALGLAGAPAHANQIGRNDSMTCSGLGCMDVYEYRCLQTSDRICFTFDGSGGDEAAHTFHVSVVGTSPATLVGTSDGDVVADGDGVASFCLERPGKAGAMRALVGIATTSPVPPNASYLVFGECWKGDIISGTESRKTTFSLKQDE